MIKYIHCFGTSFSAGGGFEFESKQIFKPKLKKLYANCGEKLTQFNFSWPGQLQKLLNNNHKIKVINHSKSGFGNQTMYRIAYDLISDSNFNHEENLFIFEFSYVGRREYFLNSIDDYVVLNYTNIDDIEKGGHFEMGYEYFYDSDSIQKKLSDFKKLLLNFFRYSKNQKNIQREIEQNNTIFYNFLKNLGINFLFSAPPIPISLFGNEKSNFLFKEFNEHFIKIEDGKNSHMGVSNLIYNTKDEYSIFKETDGIIDDMHLGLRGNRLVAVNVFNTLIKNEYISDTEIDVKTVLDEKINVGNFI